MALIKCPEYGREISDQSGMCVYCGYRFKVCYNCHQILSENEEYCGRCGANLSNRIGKVAERMSEHGVVSEIKNSDGDKTTLLYSNPIDTWLRKSRSDKIMTKCLDIITMILPFFIAACVVPFLIYIGVYIKCDWDIIQKSLATDSEAQVEALKTLTSDILFLENMNDVAKKFIFLAMGLLIAEEVLVALNKSIVVCRLRIWLKKEGFNISAALPRMTDRTYTNKNLRRVLISYDKESIIPVCIEYAVYHIIKLLGIIATLIFAAKVVDLLTTIELLKVQYGNLAYEMVDYGGYIAGGIIIGILDVLIIIGSIAYNTIFGFKYKLLAR